MTKSFLLLSLFCTLFFVTGCNNNVKNDGVDKLEMLKVNIAHSIRQSMSIAIRSEGIEKKYGKADITRKLSGKTYEIRNIADGSKLFVTYDDATNRVIDMWQLKQLLDAESFKMIEKRKTTESDIMRIDPYTTIIETSKDKAVSEHRLKRNQVILIEYIKQENSWVVVRVNIKEEDISGFPTILVPEDLMSIS